MLVWFLSNASQTLAAHTEMKCMDGTARSAGLKRPVNRSGARFGDFQCRIQDRLAVLQA